MGQQFVFGTGQIFTTPVGGGAPLRLGTLQDVSVDFSSDIKQLYGQYQLPVSVARGKTKVEGKASTGELNLDTYNALYFNEEVVTGEKVQAINEQKTVPASSPYTVTATNGANFFMDLGVYNATTGLPLKQVASGPTTGQYSVNPATGVYTFAAADAGIKVLLNYLWDSDTTGSTLAITNLLMGSAPKYQLVLSETYEDMVFTMMLYSCTSAKLSMPFKQDDFMISGIDFQAQANAANQLGFLTQTAKSIA
jgi:hypothetical protein